ncbi:MAG: preprotein translocase subunit YajC, partial [Duncaniella sp.]|nr:preprotein translocase subunit YajC [Duncaniella sp.]
ANIAMIVALIAIFYLFMIRPQQKKQNEIKKFREGLKAGDSIVTAGGIYGKIRSVNDTTFVVEIAKDVKITIDKGSVYPSAAQADKDAASK